MVPDIKKRSNEFATNRKTRRIDFKTYPAVTVIQ